MAQCEPVTVAATVTRSDGDSLTRIAALVDALVRMFTELQAGA